ncbi:MAG: MFS transporter [Proteobacteria bacterium]|nr:MFS transporter [Pseudomonadota bacterium]
MPPPPPSPEKPALGGSYAHYSLGVLVLVYVFNFLDRQILSILNEKIKADLLLTDAQMGFLYGTAFAVFYALFGIPLGRLADVWTRRSLIAIGLTVWSAMTAVSGFARNFAQIGAARIGVGVGEASASPAAFSMLSDLYPPARRATVLAIYSSGIYIAAGLGIMIGGQIVDRWDNAYAGMAAPFGLAGWQVAFLAVGLPGLLLAIWVRTLREPVRGQADGILTPTEPHPWREFFKELAAVMPGFSLWRLQQLGATGKTVRNNLLILVGVGVTVVTMAYLTTDWAQWLALGVGLYAAGCWVQTLRLRDPATAALVFETPSLRYAAIGFAFLSFTGYGLGYWTVPFFLRVHNVSESEAGLVLGGIAALGGWLGVTLGGVAADFMRQRSPTGRLKVGLATALLPVPFGYWLYTTADTTTAYWVNLPVSILTSMWIGAGASTMQDLVLPRMRASTSAFYLLVLTFIGLALGPYTIGRLSDGLGSLRLALLLGFTANVFAMVFLFAAVRHLETDEATLRERARAAGEPDV